jgi:hypothetical protein
VHAHRIALRSSHLGTGRVGSGRSSPPRRSGRGNG